MTNSGVKEVIVRLNYLWLSLANTVHLLPETTYMSNVLARLTHWSSAAWHLFIFFLPELVLQFFLTLC